VDGKAHLIGAGLDRTMTVVTPSHVLVALAIGFVVTLAFSRATVRAEEVEVERLARPGTGARRAA
jgi:hypothetical protein